MRSYKDVPICSVCGKTYTDELDKVYCSVCGASYHRECYKTKNKCVFEELHGTEYEYNGERAEEMIRRYINGEEDLRVEMPEIPFEPRNETPKAVSDQTKNEPDVEIEEENLFGNFVKVRQIKVDQNSDSQINFGEKGLPLAPGFYENDDIGGVTAGDAAKFVVFNYARFVTLFAKMAKAGKKASFNLLAFLFPECWFFMRKHYLAGFCASLLLVASKIFLLPSALFFEQFIGENAKYFEFVAAVSEHITELSPLNTAFLFISVALTLIVHLGSGIFGDLIYKKFAFSKIKEYRKNEPKGNGLKLSVIGGINPLLIFIGTAITTFLPQIVQMLLF